jgi:uncharacterized protein DUF4388
MAKGRDNAAESLGEVVELIRVRRQSGLLGVERMQSGRFEEGEIYFQNGVPVFASSGQMSGQEALVWLLSWRNVYFAFSAEDTRHATNIPAAKTTGEGTTIPASPVTGPASAGRPPASTNTVANSNRIPPPNMPPTPPGSPTATPPRGLNEGATRTAAAPAQATQAPQPSYQPDSTASPSATPGLEWLTPQKVGGERDVLSLPLTRPQRSIYLLVDGRRTVADLSRCTRKSIQEIERLLSELQEHGLISI